MPEAVLEDMAQHGLPSGRHQRRGAGGGSLRNTRTRAGLQAVSETCPLPVHPRRRRVTSPCIPVGESVPSPCLPVGESVPSPCILIGEGITCLCIPSPCIPSPCIPSPCVPVGAGAAAKAAGCGALPCEPLGASTSAELRRALLAEVPLTPLQLVFLMRNKTQSQTTKTSKPPAMNPYPPPRSRLLPNSILPRSWPDASARSALPRQQGPRKGWELRGGSVSALEPPRCRTKSSAGQPGSRSRGQGTHPALRAECSGLQTKSSLHTLHT